MCYPFGNPNEETKSSQAGVSQSEPFSCRAQVFQPFSFCVYHGLLVSIGTWPMQQGSCRRIRVAMRCWFLQWR